jgi:hypothetical protein
MSRRRRPQPRDHRGRYARGPQSSPWMAAFVIVFAVLLVILVNL